MEWTQINMRIWISIEESKIKEMIFKKLNEYTRLFEYKCTTTTIVLYKTKTNIYMNIYIYIWRPNICTDMHFVDGIALSRTGQIMSRFSGKILEHEWICVMCHRLFHLERAWRSYWGQIRRHHTEDTHTLTRMRTDTPNRMDYLYWECWIFLNIKNGI